MLINEQKTIEFKAVLQSDPTVSLRRDDQSWLESNVTTVAIRVESIQTEQKLYRVRVPALLFVDNGRDEQLQHAIPGMWIQGFARVQQPGVGSPYAMYLQATTHVNVHPITPRYQYLASKFRDGLVAALRHCPPQARQLVPGLALGDTRALSAELSAHMRDAGLSHLTAVSGANVTVLLLVVMACTRKRQLPVQVAVAIVALAAFVIVVRPQPSVLRAAVMGVIVLLGTLLHRKSESLALLCIATLMLLFTNPLLAVSYGFALSVAATAGLVLWGSRMEAWLLRYTSRRIPLWLVQGAVVTVCAQIAVAPLLIALGSGLSLASIPANLICVPLASVAMLLGVVTAVLAGIWFPLAQVVAWIPALAAVIIANVAKFASGLTWLIIPWPHGLFGITLSLAVIVTAIWVISQWTKLTAQAQSATLGVVALFVASIWFHPTTQWRMWPSPNWVMMSCDVGQGDATIFKVAPHQAVVIDVGPDPVPINRCLTDLRITSIPLLVLSHFHADHVGGLAGALAGRNVGMVRTSPLSEPEITFQFTTHTLKSKNLAWQPMRAMETITVSDVSIKCLWPTQIIRGQGSDPNNASLVLLVRTAGFSFLLAGDVEAPAQHLIAQGEDFPQVDVIKIAHHGSRNQDSKFAERAKAKIGLISDGQRNHYGHPSPETIALYQAIGTSLYRTDEHGDLLITASGPHTTFEWLGNSVRFHPQARNRGLELRVQTGH